MRGRSIASLAVASMVALTIAGLASSAFANPPNWAFQKVAPNADDWYAPSVSGDRVAWAAAPFDQICTWEAGSSVTTLTSGTTGSEYPVVSGERLAWIDGSGDILTWTPNSAIATLATNGVLGSSPEVSGERVVWMGYDGSHTQICTWKAGSSVTTLTSGAPNHDFPAVSGDRVVWEDGNGGDILTWTPSSSVTTLATNGFADAPLQVSGDRVVWAGTDGGIDQICTWKAGSSVTTLTSGAPGKVEPAVSGDRVVWEDWNNNVLTWTPGSSVTTLATNGNHANFERPQVSGDRVVWMGYGGDYDQVCTWRAGDSSVTTLTNDATDSVDPAVSGDRVVWLEGDMSSFVTSLETAVFVPTATSVAKPSISPKSPKHGRSVTFTSTLSPANATGTSTLLLWQSTIKTVKVKIHGKWRKVKVSYWKSRGTVRMIGSSGKLTAKVKLHYKGSWKAQILFNGSHDFSPSGSRARTFTVK